MFSALVVRQTNVVRENLYCSRYHSLEQDGRKTLMRIAYDNIFKENANYSTSVRFPWRD